MWKVGQKWPFFSNERHFQIWFPKKKTITFFLKVNYLIKHKKDPILHVTTTFSPKQGETRTSSGPIPHPLSPRYSPAWAHGVLSRSSAVIWTWPVYELAASAVFVLKLALCDHTSATIMTAVLWTCWSLAISRSGKPYKTLLQQSSRKVINAWTRFSAVAGSRYLRTCPILRSVKFAARQMLLTWDAMLRWL